VLPSSRKKRRKDRFDAKNAQLVPSQREINRTNLFFAGRAVSLPTREQKLVSLALN
jgi:hypothetical protein